MKKSNLTLAITISLLFLSNLSQGGNFTWNGSVNTLCTKSNNWTPAGNPGSNDTIQIVSVTTNNNLVLDANKTVTRLILTSDTLDLGGFTLIATGSSSFSSGYITNGTLDLRGSSALFSGTKINATVSAVCTAVNFNGSVFNQPVVADITGTNANTSNGSNVFNASLFVKNSSGAPVVFSNTHGDIYNGDVTVFDTLNKTILFGASDSSFFNGNIYVNSKGAGVSFGSSTGFVKLASGKTITVGTLGYSSGTLLLTNFFQDGATVQNLTLTNSAILSCIASSFSGNVTLTSPNLLVKTTNFYGKSIFT